MNEPFYAALMIAAAFLAAVSQILLKISADKKHTGRLKEYLNPYVITGYGMLALSLLVNMYAYQKIDLRYGPVLNAASYIFVLLLGRLILKEKITQGKLCGNLLIMLGIVIALR